MKPVFLNLLMISLSLTSAYAAEGDRTGNGGEVVIRNGKALLFDFVEAGIEDEVEKLSKEKRRPTFQETPYDKYLEETLSVSLSRTPFSKEVRAILQTRWGLINSFDALFLAGTIQIMHWNFPNEPLKRVKDNESPVDIEVSQRYQAAHRRGKDVFINRSLLKKMSASQLAGLVNHEVLYAMAAEGLTQSYPIRQLNSRIFNTPVSSERVEDWSRIHFAPEKWEGRFVFRYKPWENAGLSVEWPSAYGNPLFLKVNRPHYSFEIIKPYDLFARNEQVSDRWISRLQFKDLSSSIPMIQLDREKILKAGSDACNDLTYGTNPLDIKTAYDMQSFGVEFTNRIFMKDNSKEIYPMTSIGYSTKERCKEQYPSTMVEYYEETLKELRSLDYR